VTADDPPIEALIEAIVALGGPLTSIVSHMVETQMSGRGAPNAASIPNILRGLLRDVLDPLRDEFSADEILASGRALQRATDQICGEIYLVNMEGADDEEF
jgi:hypothetical protein